MNMAPPPFMAEFRRNSLRRRKSLDRWAIISAPPISCAVLFNTKVLVMFTAVLPEMEIEPPCSRAILDRNVLEVMTTLFESCAKEFAALTLVGVKILNIENVNKT